MNGPTDIASLTKVLERLGYRVHRDEKSSRLYLDPIGLQEEAMKLRHRCQHCGVPGEHMHGCLACGAPR